MNRQTSLVYTHLNKKSISFWFPKYTHGMIIITQVTLYPKCTDTNCICKAVFKNVPVAGGQTCLCSVDVCYNWNQWWNLQSMYVGETDMWLTVFFHTVHLALQLQLLFANPGTYLCPRLGLSSEYLLLVTQHWLPNTRLSCLLLQFFWPLPNVLALKPCLCVTLKNVVLWSCVVPLHSVFARLSCSPVFNTWLSLAYVLSAFEFILNTE